MTEQEKRDWVIKGLEQYQEAGWTGINDYYRPFIIDALDVLKVQKPRAMTLEEVKELHPDDDVYIERISSITGVHYIYATTTWRVVSKSIMFCPDNATLWFSEYGETWRCWTSRPTDAQRKATAWDC